MDEYWKKVGEEIIKRKQESKFAIDTQKKCQYKLNIKCGKHKYAHQNRNKWPKGSRIIFRILMENHIYFKREQIIGFSGGKFRQSDFSISKLKLFIEIDGPEHTKWKDEQRENQILARPLYKNWQFYRIKSHVAADYEKAIVALKPIVEMWNLYGELASQ